MDTGELQGQHVVLGNVLSEIKTKVMYRLIEDEALCMLLYYDTPDALDHNITAKQIQELILQKSTNKQRRIFLPIRLHRSRIAKSASISDTSAWNNSRTNTGLSCRLTSFATMT